MRSGPLSRSAARFHTLAARGERPASHRGRRGAPAARRDDREYGQYLSEEQRSRRGRIGGRMQSSLQHGLLAALLIACGLMVIHGLVASAQSPQKAVLVLIPLQRGSSMSLDIDDTIRTVLNDGLAGQLDYYTEYLDVARFPEPDYQPAVRDFFRRKYARQTFDMV